MYLSRNEHTGKIRIVGETAVYLTRMSYAESVFLSFWARRGWLGKFWTYVRANNLITEKKERNNDMPKLR